jgi:hypothetical protein
MANRLLLFILNFGRFCFSRHDEITWNLIQGLSHLTFVVRDLDKMAEIITDVLGGVEVYVSGERTSSTLRYSFLHWAVSLGTCWAK